GSRVARPLGEERGRVQRRPQERGLLLVRHRRLGRLASEPDRDAEALLEELVQRPPLEVGGLEPRHERGGKMEPFDPDRVLVCKSQPDRPNDLRRRRHSQGAPEPRVGGDDLECERPARRGEALPLHLGREGAERRPRRGDEGAAAGSPLEPPLADELVDRRAERQPRHAEVDAQLPLRRNRGSDVELTDELEHAAAGLVALPHAPAPRRWSSPVLAISRIEGENRRPISENGQYQSALCQPLATDRILSNRRYGPPVAAIDAPRVLVVEDDESIREAVLGSLRQGGCVTAGLVDGPRVEETLGYF